VVEGRRDDARVPFDRFGRAMLRGCRDGCRARRRQHGARGAIEQMTLVCMTTPARRDRGYLANGYEANVVRTDPFFVVRITMAETKSSCMVRCLHGRSRRQGRRRGWQDAAAGELAEECQPVDPEVQPAPRVTSEVEREGPIVAERAHDHLARVRVGFALE